MCWLEFMRGCILNEYSAPPVHAPVLPFVSQDNCVLWGYCSPAFLATCPRRPASSCLLPLFPRPPPSLSRDEALSPAGRRVCRYEPRLHLPSALPGIRQRQPLRWRLRNGNGSIVARWNPQRYEKDCVPTTNIFPCSYFPSELLLYFDPLAGGRKGEL